MSFPPLGRLVAISRIFAIQDHIELKERLFSVFFVILRGYTNFKTALAGTWYFDL
jgi:hypothetical protein